MIAALDRWVRVIEPEEVRGRHYRVSELRAHPRVVLLGEPGIGKTTVLADEATYAGAEPIGIRALLRAPLPARAGPLFIDALDQTRRPDTADERIDALGAALARGAIDRWWLACRTEDWRGRADVEALVPRAEADPIIVAQLLPLEHEEAVAVLAALGEAVPEAFLEQAAALGALAFTESPLTLSLLHRVVSADDAWPATRFALFERATSLLAQEWDSARGHVVRAPEEAVRDAAGIVSLLLLVTGAEALWRRSTPPPSGAEARYLVRDVCRIAPEVLNDLLDSALMRGEGDALAPVHRTIVEFLAARTLAARVATDDGDRAAYPLRRALALVADTDGIAPSELRGVHAWLGVHLWQRGRTNDARRLLERDPVSALFHGDVAVFDTPARRTLLYALPKSDPYFRIGEGKDSALAKLAGEDLAEDFRAILEGDAREDHLVSTVLDALAGGLPIPALADTLERVVLDPGRPDGFRRRAIDALLRICPDAAAEARRLRERLGETRASRDREGLRAKLIATLPFDAIDPALVADVLITHTRSPRDNKLFGLYPLLHLAQETPWPAALDALVERQPLPWTGLAWASDALEVLLELFVGSVDADKDLTVERLVRWVTVLDPDGHRALESCAVGAVDRWLGADAGREVALFEAIRDAFGERDRWIAHTYRKISGHDVSQPIATHLLAAIDRASSTEARHEALDVAVDLFLSIGYDALPDAWWSLQAHLHDDEAHHVLFERLATCRLEGWQFEDARRRADKRRRDRITRRWRLRRLNRQLEKIRSGWRDDTASHGARLYLAAALADGVERGLEKVRDVYTDEITDAIVDRWITLAREGLGEVGSRELGEAIGGNERWYMEAPAVAGVHLLLERGEIGDDLPLAVLLCVLGRTFEFVRDDAEREQLYRVAAHGLCTPADGLAALRTYWDAALDAGSTTLPGANALKPDTPEQGHRAIAEMLCEMLSARPDLPSAVLREAVRLVAEHGGSARLPALAHDALSGELSEDARRLWLALGIELDPAAFSHHLETEDDLAGLTAALADHAMGKFTGPLVRDDPTTRAERALLVLEYVAPHVPTVREESEDGTVTAAVRRRDAVDVALHVLATNSDSATARRVSALCERAALAPWRSYLAHVLAQQAAIRRDRAFARPDPDVVRAALDGGAPVSAADLRAIVLEELEYLGSTLHTGPSRPWLQFWNTDANGKPTKPRVENVCRDRVLERLADRLERYRIAATIPEAARAEGTRADILVLSGAGASIPLELKRHNHPDLWSAATTQLQTYAATPDAAGLGIYLVLWFGRDWDATPPHPAGGPSPGTAEDTDAALTAVLPESLRATTDIVVFDVSKPDVMTRRRRTRRKGVRASAPRTARSK